MTRHDALALVQLALLAGFVFWVMFAGVRLYCTAIVLLNGAIY